MGRQIAVKLSRKKEEEFYRFLKGRNCVIIIHWSKKKEINTFNGIPPAGPYTWNLSIWNKKFKFMPSFIKIKKDYKNGPYNYGLRIFGKPLIEYSRGGVFRIYWEKYFTTTNPDYDVDEFEKWYDEVANWIKKNCKYIEGVYVG